MHGDKDTHTHHKQAYTHTPLTRAQTLASIIHTHANARTRTRTRTSAYAHIRTVTHEHALFPICVGAPTKFLSIWRHALLFGVEYFHPRPVTHAVPEKDPTRPDERGC